MSGGPVNGASGTSADLPRASSGAYASSAIGRGSLRNGEGGGAAAPADPRAVLARQKAKRHNVVDIRDYEDVVAELAHRKLEIAFGKARILRSRLRCLLVSC